MRVFEYTDQDGNVQRFSVDIDAGVKSFVGRDGKNADRQFVSVGIWEHVNTDRKYQNQVLIAKGWSFCMPSDEFNYKLGVKQATVKALDQIGFSDGREPLVKEVHSVISDYIKRNDLDMEDFSYME